MFVYCLSAKQKVYHRNKWFITKTKGLSAKQKVYQQNKWFWG
jgi:hypothetical protein